MRERGEEGREIENEEGREIVSDAMPSSHDLKFIRNEEGREIEKEGGKRDRERASEIV